MRNARRDNEPTGDRLKWTKVSRAGEPQRVRLVPLTELAPTHWFRQDEMTRADGDRKPPREGIRPSSVPLL